MTLALSPQTLPLQQEHSMLTKVISQAFSIKILQNLIILTFFLNVPLLVTLAHKLMG